MLCACSFVCISYGLKFAHLYGSFGCRCEFCVYACGYGSDFLCMFMCNVNINNLIYIPKFILEKKLYVEPSLSCMGFQGHL